MNSVDKEILERFFNGESGKEAADYIQEAFTSESKKTALKSFLANQWNCFLDNTDVPEKDLDHVLHKIHFRINIANSIKDKRTVYKIWKFYYRAAAVLLLPLLIAGGIRLHKHVRMEKNYSQIAWAEIHSTMGSRVSFSLPDGSKGWLNSGSTLKYPMNFIENRRVELEGEAYFDVITDKSHPFYVNTSEIQLKVLGTKFNVKSYYDDKTVEATILTGLVEIETISQKDGEKQKIILQPNQKAIFQKSIDRLTVHKKQDISGSLQGVQTVRIYQGIDTIPIVSWKNNKLVFMNEPFESLLVKMERWYDVEINLTDTAVNNLSYTGTFGKETVEQALRALQIATPNFSYTINKNKIIVLLKE